MFGQDYSVGVNFSLGGNEVLFLFHWQPGLPFYFDVSITTLSADLQCLTSALSQCVFVCVCLI